MTTSGLKEELSCSICLHLYMEPISLRCGHNYCQECIVTLLDTQEMSGVYSCPECRQKYTERPQLEKNRKLRNIVDNFRSTHQEDTEVFCTYCDSPVPAIKSCMLCEASFCNKHLGSHSKSTEHVLTEPTKSFEDRKCSTHKEILKYYCSEDRACICMSCWVAGEHKGHQVELLKEASEKRKEKLEDVIEELNTQRREARNRIQNLNIHRTQEKGKATDLTRRVTVLFTEIRKHLDDVEKRIHTEISRQEEQISQSATKIIWRLETQIEELSMKIHEIEDMKKVKDPITVLKREMVSPVIISSSSDGDTGSLDEGLISQMIHRGLLNFSDILLDLKMKRWFSVIKKSDILLDIKTANYYITVSQDLKSASYTSKPEKRPDVPERFKSKQVLSTQSFSSGKHYWEVDVSMAKEWLIGVAYNSIDRQIGNESYIGYNDKSWGLGQRDVVKAAHKNIHLKTDAESPVNSLGSIWIIKVATCPFTSCVTPSDTFTPSPPPSLSLSTLLSTCLKTPLE